VAAALTVAVAIAACLPFVGLFIAEAGEHAVNLFLA
jgi:hypothetical protein